MTSIEQEIYGHRRYAIRRSFAKLMNRWGERRRKAQGRRTLASLPDRLLRDIGHEHLIEIKQVRAPGHFWL